jgi:hypothetical protein
VFKLDLETPSFLALRSVLVSPLKSHSPHLSALFLCIHSCIDSGDSRVSSHSAESAARVVDTELCRSPLGVSLPITEAGVSPFVTLNRVGSVGVSKLCFFLEPSVVGKGSEFPSSISSLLPSCLQLDHEILYQLHDRPAQGYQTRSMPLQSQRTLRDFSPNSRVIHNRLLCG